jgi:hypothetical protein
MWHAGLSAELFLERGYFVQPSLVTTSLEIGVQPGSHHFASFILVTDPSAENEDIRVVVLFRHLGHIGVGGKGRPDSRKLVGHYGHSYAGSANKNALFGLARRNLACDLFAKIRVIDGIAVIRARIQNGDAPLHEESFDSLLEFEPAMVASQRYHSIHGHTFLKRIDALVPPKPKELDRAQVIFASLAVFGT